MSASSMADTTFSKLSHDVTLDIFALLEDDPRTWARLSCVCRKFNSLISSVCCKSKCLSSLPSITSDLLSPSASDGYASLYKIAVCCPGLLDAGVLLDNSDFGLDREIGHTEEYLQSAVARVNGSKRRATESSSTVARVDDDSNSSEEYGGWSLYDDLYFDTLHDNSETGPPMEVNTGVVELDRKYEVTNEENNKAAKRHKANVSRPQQSHLACGVWNLSREQGKKLLAGRFGDDCLYISEWPGCLHIEDKRHYMLFRGVFKNFKRTRVWRTINDGNRSRIHLNCAFCGCKDTWDLLSAFCLKRGFGFHDDGEPVVRAYVCENGHVSGAWTRSPLCT